MNFQLMRKKNILIDFALFCFAFFAEFMTQWRNAERSKAMGRDEQRSGNVIVALMDANKQK